ncbi:TWiK family of potassium channels protein 18-like isoform X2 [Leptidea sinapis]|uniref:TWiK family of potassium channels protein 18-like isoform X2 n=1 Tax=Leptidea sinapis TaxID=189913 RepID=UPI00212E566B|nr:TWiK family of potassium channels protein 18-like isoform X2 [Leptidea sinapis]
MNITENTTNIIIHKMPETWLRVYPAPMSDEESTCSVIVRCVVCQIGLTSFLILWTIIGVFVIQSFEGPHEREVSIRFEDEQNQLVIDLATELRQITPVSPKWKYAIEKRIEQERKLTVEAVGHGANIKPGQFWTLSGTFLFGVYVMTALGFGAPVPHTIWGRTSSLVYAILAVPTHIYLMVNASTCLVANVDRLVQSWKLILAKKRPNSKIENQFINENPDCCRNSESWKKSKKNFCQAITSCMSIFCFGYGIPMVIILYYILGVVGFGVLRSKNALDCAMFPLEFTTTGGLAQVESYIRVLYGVYVEGAMCILSCTLATIRRYSTKAITGLTDNYRLFTVDKCSKCSE